MKKLEIGNRSLRAVMWELCKKLGLPRGSVALYDKPGEQCSFDVIGAASGPSEWYGLPIRYVG